VNAPAPSAVAEILQRGLGAHQSGRLPEAEAAYRQILAMDGGHADALHLLGVLAHQVGRNAAAAELIGQAIAKARRRADFHCNLGLVLNQLGRPGDAEAALTTALILKRDYPDALNNLGIAQAAQGRHAAAEASYRKALRLQANFPDALNNLGLAQVALGGVAEAEGSYRQALRLAPDMADAHGNLGIALYRQGRAAEAEASYRETLRLAPQHWDALNNLGVLLSDAGRLVEAEGFLAEAVRLRPDKADAYGNLGVVLTSLGRPAEAEQVLRHGLSLAPAQPEGHFNLGAALAGTGREAEAEASYREALRLRPDFADAHTNLAYALLLAGRLEEGWREYEWRWGGKHLAGGARNFPVPQWGGEALGERVLLLHAEQGLGDTLQFCRYLTLIEPGARIVLEVQAPLTRLLGSLPGVGAVVAQGEPLPAFDLHSPLMSLPLAFATTLETIPAPVPYLSAEPEAARRWRARLASFAGLKVGLVWAGGLRTGFADLAAVDRRRSMTLGAMAPLGEVGGMSLFSLQKGGPADQTAEPPPGLALTDFTAELADFADTAAFIDALDLVISVDTAVAHLAGAMGKRVWLLNRYDTCWRWLLEREDSPWYPTLRQFRQSAPGDWPEVMQRVRDALRELAKQEDAR
jgi:Flp pilus assembly protein TadD